MLYDPLDGASARGLTDEAMAELEQWYENRVDLEIKSADIDQMLADSIRNEEDALLREGFTPDAAHVIAHRRHGVDMPSAFVRGLSRLESVA